jgi:hypothetical protein
MRPYQVKETAGSGMAGLVPAIHAVQLQNDSPFSCAVELKQRAILKRSIGVAAWMSATSAGMTESGDPTH